MIFGTTRIDRPLKLGQNGNQGPTGSGDLDTRIPYPCGIQHFRTILFLVFGPYLGSYHYFN
jgi:hypothetical protein